MLFLCHPNNGTSANIQFFFTDYRRLTTIFANVNLQVVFAMIFRYVFRKFSENINKTLIAARPLSARDSRNVMYLFGFGVVDKKMFYTSCNIVKAERKGKYTARGNKVATERTYRPRSCFSLGLCPKGLKPSDSLSRERSGLRAHQSAGLPLRCSSAGI